jgi:hypothetical protein
MFSQEIDCTLLPKKEFVSFRMVQQQAKFIWIIRSWSSEDSFWEHVRDHKEYDIAYTKPEMLLDEIHRITIKEQTDWEDLCQGSGLKHTDREFEIEKPSLDQLKNRSFYKFLTISSTSSSGDDFMQSWYIERLKVVTSD